MNETINFLGPYNKVEDIVKIEFYTTCGLTQRVHHNLKNRTV